MTEAWKEYAADFNAMSDEKIDYEYNYSLNIIDEHESWVEAVDSWKAAGKPRKKENNNDE